MVVVLIVGGGLGWVARRERVQRQAVAAIRSPNAFLTYSPEWMPVREGPDGPFMVAEPLGPGIWSDWLVERFGRDLFYDVKEVRLADPDQATLEAVGRLEGVEVLYMAGDLPDANDLSMLRGMGRLRWLILVNTNVTGAGLIDLKGMTQLENLQIVGTPLTDADLAVMSSLTGLRSMVFDASAITDVGLAHLSGLSRLRQLPLSYSKVTSAGLRSLAGLTELTSLSLDFTKVDDLSAIRDLTRLRRLSLKGCPIDDKGVAPIGGFTAMKDLDVSYTRITGAGIGILAGLSKLERLKAGHTGIDDTVFRVLDGKPALHEVELVETRTTFPEKHAFLKRYPGVNILY